MSLAICSAVIFRQPAVFVLNSLSPFVHVFLPVGLDASVMPSWPPRWVPPLAP